MAVIDQRVTDRWVAYNGDCVEVMRGLPEKSVHLSVYSPPFAGLYHYSSDPRDVSNCRSYEEFIEITKPEHPHNAAWRQVSSYSRWPSASRATAS